MDMRGEWVLAVDRVVLCGAIHFLTCVLKSKGKSQIIITDFRYGEVVSIGNLCCFRSLK